MSIFAKFGLVVGTLVGAVAGVFVGGYLVGLASEEYQNISLVAILAFAVLINVINFKVFAKKKQK